MILKILHIIKFNMIKYKYFNKKYYKQDLYKTIAFQPSAGYKESIANCCSFVLMPVSLLRQSSELLT